MKELAKSQESRQAVAPTRRRTKSVAMQMPNGLQQHLIKILTKLEVHFEFDLKSQCFGFLYSRYESALEADPPIVVHIIPLESETEGHRFFLRCSREISHPESLGEQVRALLAQQLTAFAPWCSNGTHYAKLEKFDFNFFDTSMKDQGPTEMVYSKFIVNTDEYVQWGVAADFGSALPDDEKSTMDFLVKCLYLHDRAWSHGPSHRCLDGRTANEVLIDTDATLLFNLEALLAERVESQPESRRHIEIAHLAGGAPTLQ